MIADSGKRPAASPDDFDALADLFMGPKGAAAPAAAAGAGGSAASATQRSGSTDGDRASARRGIELLVLGHLPVMAGAWASQFARHRAAMQEQSGAAGGVRSGAVAMARLVNGHLRLDLYLATASPTLRESLAADAPTTLGEAVQFLNRQHVPVLLHAPGKDELLLAGAPGIGRVTLLTAIDQASCVAAYGSIKSLVRHTHKTSEEGGASGVPIAVGVMAAAEDRARTVWHRFNRAAETFLGVTLELAACIPQIQSGSAPVTLWSGAFEDPARVLIAALNAGATSTADKHTVTLAELATLDEEADAEVLNVEGPVDPAPAAASGGLAGHVPGLRPIDVRCPWADDVELAVDAAGVVHALAQTREGARDHRVLERLHAAAAWAVVHRGLLTRIMGAGGGGAGFATRSVLHVFTDRPAEYRGLLDSPVRVHLLAAVVQTPQGVFVSAALN